MIDIAGTSDSNHHYYECDDTPEVGVMVLWANHAILH